MTTPAWYANYGGDQPANDRFEDDGVTPNAATLVMISHTGTLDTTGHGGGKTDVTWTRGPGAGDDVLVGVDQSAASINPFLDPTLNPADLPDGHVAAPVYTDPIY